MNNLASTFKVPGAWLHCHKNSLSKNSLRHLLAFKGFNAPFELIASLGPRTLLVGLNPCHTKLVLEQVHYLPLQVGLRVLHSLALHFESNSRLEPIWSTQRSTVPHPESYRNFLCTAVDHPQRHRLTITPDNPLSASRGRPTPIVGRPPGSSGQPLDPNWLTISLHDHLKRFFLSTIF